VPHVKMTPAARRYYKGFSEWEITRTDCYKRLHLRFAATFTLLGGSILWNIFFLINPTNARSIWWLFVIVMPIFVFCLWQMHVKDHFPKKGSSRREKT